jgi:hypothetical protein
MPKKECKWYRVCPVRHLTENGELDPCWAREYCHGDWERCARYKAEEAGIPHSDRLLPDGSYLQRII